jgi:cytochrome P450
MTMDAHASLDSERKCPVLPDFNPMTTAGGFDLLPMLARARQDAPVFHMPAFGMWCVTRYEEARDVLRDHKRFSTEPYVNGQNVPAEITAIMGPDYRGPITPDTLLPSSPPKHTRVRRAFQSGWSASNIQRYEGDIRAYANELIDAFVGDKHADLVDDYAGPLAVGVVSDLLGLPKEWRARFRDYTLALFRGPLATSAAESEQQLLADWHTVVNFDRSFAEYVELRRREPADDLTTDTLRSNTDDEGQVLLTDQEIVRNVQGIAIAGSDTSVNLIGHAVYLLLTHGQWSDLQQDRSLIPNAVEEVLRVRGGITGGLFRKTLMDVEIGGVTIPEGSLLFVSIPSCNHDEAAFTDPGTFDIHRQNAKDHLSFGRGNHLCIGAPLARLEATISLQCFLDRLPGLRLRDPGAPLVYEPNMMIAKLRELPVEWD